MHASIDFGFHKLATMPPSRPSDSSFMVTKVLGLTPLHQTTLLKSQQYKGSSTLTGLLPGPCGTEMDMGHGLSSYFPNSHVSWMCPMIH